MAASKVFLSVFLIAVMIGGLVWVDSVQFGNAETSSAGTSIATVSQLWNFSTGETEVSSPVVANGLVYVTSITSDLTTLYCLNTSNGAQIWNTTSLFTGSSTEFTLANGYIYLSVCQPGAVYCLNASSGAKIWSYFYGHNFNTPVVAGNTVY